MFRSFVRAGAGGRPEWIALGLVVGVLSASRRAGADTPGARRRRPRRPTRACSPSDGGMVLNFIKADKTADFEAVMAKLKEALQKSDKPERKQQAASWKVFKSPDPAAAATCSTSSSSTRREGRRLHGVEHPRRGVSAAEVKALFKQYAEAYAQGRTSST